MASPQDCNFYGNEDKIMFAWQDVTGDFDCSFRFSGVDGVSYNDQKVMLLARSGLSDGVPFAAAVMNFIDGNHDANRFSAKYRDSAEGGIADVDGSFLVNEGKTGWLRLVRRGRTFMFLVRASESGPWTRIGSKTFADGVELGSTLQIGPAVAGKWNGNNNMRPVNVSGFKIEKPSGLIILIR